jgi:hypothetical protein
MLDVDYLLKLLEVAAHLRGYPKLTGLLAQVDAELGSLQLTPEEAPAVPAPAFPEGSTYQTDTEAELPLGDSQGAN